MPSSLSKCKNKNALFSDARVTHNAPACQTPKNPQALFPVLSYMIALGGSGISLPSLFPFVSHLPWAISHYTQAFYEKWFKNFPVETYNFRKIHIERFF